ncbi:MAG: hypothetical protein BroJett018_52600 [Chloroflexota bacterium]|nr:MAG: hypothetical protein BroJett018_52600 [Chloroflexota bacterium]
MRPISSKRWMFTLAACLTLLVGLLVLSDRPSSAQDPATPTPDPNDVTTSEPFEATFGPGPFNLMLPEAGLETLSSYRATLILSFDGTLDGQPSQWSRTYTMLVNETGRQLTIEKVDNGTASSVFMAEVNGTAYERRDENSCFANAVELEGAFAAEWEPAGFLDSVIGAEETGTDTVNDIAANHYTFDESAQGALDIADSTGELWVASDGGYLLRYTLVTTGDPDYFGAGVEGTLSWDYTLSDINQPLTIELPADCPPGILDVPIMADAVDAVELPGYTSYTTPSSIQDAIAFYQEQVEALGGQSDNPPTIAENTALFGFTLNGQAILLVVGLDETGGTTTVNLYGMADPTGLAFAAEVPDLSGNAGTGDVPTVEVPAGVPTLPNTAGTTVCVPPLPDAANVQNLAGTIMFTTSMSVADAVSFYEEQAAAAGATVTSQMPATDTMAMLQISQGGQDIVVMLTSAGGFNSVTIMSMTGGSATLCQ